MSREPSDTSSDGQGEGNARKSVDALVLPDVADYLEFSATYEQNFAERLLAASQADDGLSVLYKSSRSIIVEEFENKTNAVVLSKAEEPQRSAVLVDTVRAAVDFYTRPWKSVALDSSMLSYPANIPALLQTEKLGVFEPIRNVFHLPRIPFQAEGVARHFLVQNLCLRSPAAYAEEPVVVSVSVWDREMGQKVTSDMSFCLPGSKTKEDQLSPRLQEAAKQRTRRTVFSVQSASRDVFFVFMMYRLFRSQGTYGDKKTTVAGPPVSSMMADEALSELWEPFGVALCPTLREGDRAGYVSARGGATFKALEPLAGHVELTSVFEFRSPSITTLLEYLNNKGSSATRMDATLSLDVEVDWSSLSCEAFLDGAVAVSSPFSKPPLNVSVAARNTLFLYPLRILGSPSMFPADAAILIRVSFRPSLNCDPILLQQQSTISGASLGETLAMRSAVADCQSNCGEFLDEFCLELPLVLESGATIVFEILQLARKSGKETRLYRLNVPLFIDHTRIMPNGDHSVLLGIKADTEYASLTSGDTLNLPALKFASRFESSVYLSDLSTCTALKHLASATPVISNVANVPRMIERVNFPILLSGLLRVVYLSGKVQPTMATTAFGEVVNLLDRLHMNFPDSSSHHHPFLASYASHMFAPPAADFASVLMDVWYSMLTEPPSRDLLAKMSLSRTWVLLDILMKSIALSKSFSEADAAQDELSKPLSKMKKVSRTDDLDFSTFDQSKPTQGKPASIPSLGLRASVIGGISVNSSPVSSPQMIRKRLTESQSDMAVGESRRRGIEDLASSIATVRYMPEEFEAQFRMILAKLLQLTKCYESSESAELSILEIGKTVRFAFACMNRGFCLDLLRYTLACMDSLGWSLLVSNMLTVVFSMDDDFLSNNMPAMLGLGQMSEYETESWLRFPLVGILVERLKADLADERMASSNLIWLMVALLARHNEMPSLAVCEDDAEGEDEEEEGSAEDDLEGPSAAQRTTLRRHAVMSMYFQFVHMTLEMFASSQLTLDPAVPNSTPWFTCSLYILTQISTEMRHMWFFVESVSGINSFFNFLLAGCKLVRGTSAMNETCMQILDLVSDFARESLTGSSAHAPHVFSLLNCLFDMSSELEGTEIVTRLFATAEMIAEQNLATMFDEQHAPYVQMLVIPCIAMCNSPNDYLRESGAKFLWSLIQSNDAYRGTFVQVRLACTIAISRLVTEKKAGDTFLLKRALDSVITLASSARLELREQISEMMNRLYEVLKSTRQLSTFDDEPEMKVDICFRISEGYSGSPDLRVTWLKIVGALHKGNKDFSEAAQAYLGVAYLIAQYLDLTEHLPPGLEHAQSQLLLICPYLQSKDFVGISRDDVDNNATALRLEVWTLDGFGEVLFESAQLLGDAGLHEWSITCYNMLIALRTPQGQHLELLKAYAGAQMACKNILKSAKAPVAEAKFFRVRFVGLSFGQLNGKAYVYRGDSTQRLMDFSTFLQKRCQDNATAYGASKVELLGNDNDSKELEKQRDVLYLQIARVYPTSTSRVCSEFLLDMAFSDEKKQQQLVASQGRKKLYFTTALPFPAFARRVEILDTRTVILTPLQNALQLLNERVQNVRDATESNSATLISGLLHGSIFTVLNEGPEAVAAAFLGEGAHGEEIDELRRLAGDFVRLTGESLAVHGRLMSKDMGQWQQLAEEKFQGLKERMDKYLKE